MLRFSASPFVPCLFLDARTAPAPLAPPAPPSPERPRHAPAPFATRPAVPLGSPARRCRRALDPAAPLTWGCAHWELAGRVVPCQAPEPAGLQQKDGSEPRRESVGSQVLVQLSLKQPKQGPLEKRRGVQQGEKPVVSLETTPHQERADSNSTPKSRSADELTKQAAEGKPRPRPGDLIEIFRVGYEHWAIYVGDDCVVHLTAPSEEFEAGSITSIFSNRAIVKYSRLEDVLHGCSWKVNNKLDGTYLPLPMDMIIQRTKQMINKIVHYNLIEENCEHFVNNLRYGVPRSQQVEHAMMEGAKAARAIISAVVDTIKPKPATA
ncbi:phospholipase A and acyltransferase 5 [Rhinolophus ferrumequinum]|uniref:phospholipase A and acyltransferase 5 n=1 Tax=Rhinolophus ferrumequinum TaxID=59479 RepID=UPI00140F80A4|nr:phospholipase A and acyltransferase 5 [Rhinolophus ferrumequinum]